MISDLKDDESLINVRGDRIEDQARELLTLAVNQGSSDIHLLPHNESYFVYFRLAGKLNYMFSRTIEWGQKFISYLKYLADLDVGEKRKPQSGSTAFDLAEERIEIRLSTITNFLFHESLVIRILRSQQTQERDLQTYFPLDLEVMVQLVARKSGLILFSGPVGSGKTTVIYYLLRKRMNQEAIQVITMEDPVEIFEPNFLQTQVNEKAEISYDLLIKSSLRHHPDVLLIGEVRDEQTARMMIRGALTGHLMIATIHAKDTLGVIARLEELQISRQQLAQTLIGVVSQRLLPRYCPFCQGACDALCPYLPIQSRRAAIFELLCGQTLSQYLADEEVKFTRLNDKLKRAWLYGYIDEQTYQHFEVV
ncbi:competence type IV pilus ATPase ComGA [Ignavigranum ruoffiae]|uniref:competence type IV pilus ATPase ComGA n=1 Tax=Ignavigranum ruoffiae TaxID=89093 RepID=UPI0020670AAD|nr:competence type IV pilus ATPase ComGA [Ignavigranum ruoffiae]UPQ85794.1 competence type IV pilus ATPase ComGA [Ignavigranum ruoffiae]